MSKPRKYELEEWQYLVFSLKDAGRLRLYCEAYAANLIPPKRRWWFEVLIDLWAEPSFRWLNDSFARRAVVQASAYFSSGLPAGAMIPVPIVLGARRRAHYVGSRRQRSK